MPHGSPPGPMCRSCMQLVRTSRTSHSSRFFSLSASRRRHGLPPIFEATASQELSTLLENIRSNILLPAHLIRPQQKLVYQKKNHALLTSEPFIVEIGPKDDSEKVQLQPLDRLRDIPNSWKSLIHALRLMSQEPRQQPDAALADDADAQPPKKWANLLPLFEGMRVAGRKWKPWQWEYVVRMLGEEDAAHMLLLSAKRMERTGLYLVHLRVVREMFWACRTKAVLGGWSLETTNQALGIANQLARLLSDRRQADEAQRCVNNGEMKAAIESSSEPDVIGVVLELAARKAELLPKENASEEAIEESKSTVDTLVSRLVPNISKMQEASSRAPAGTPPAAAADYELLRWVPVARGLRLARGVLGLASNASEDIARVESDLEQRIKSSQQTVRQNAKHDRGNRRGLRWSNDA